MNLFFAPVQGHTDAPYRHFHSQTYGGNQTYYTPFIRLEKGDIRLKDMKDATSALNDSAKTIPQIIFRDEMELRALVKLIRENGFEEIDLNMGCPFPLQTGHGRGAATISNPELAAVVENVVRENEDLRFSVKMRLGLTDPYEWKTLLPHLNGISLTHIAVHPRVARQQYGGDLNLESFAQLLSESKNPVVFNGDIHSPEDLSSVLSRFPSVSGVMVGRGILGRPSLFAEYDAGEEFPSSKRIEMMLNFHRNLYSYYSDNLCGESQLISKIKPFWEYAESEIGRKAWKAIKKATTVAKYNSAVAMIER